MSEFRDLLSEWARNQLEAHSDHTGEFTIRRVRVEAVNGYSIENDHLDMIVEFSHTGCTRIHWDGTPCPVDYSWWPEPTDTVSVLNQLLALGDA